MLLLMAITQSVGVPGYSLNASPPLDRGAAFIYERNGTEYKYQAFFRGTIAGERLGYSVDISDDATDYYILGAYGIKRVDIYERDGTSWDKIHAFSDNSSFGWDISMTNDYAIVGVPFTGSGAAVLLKNDNGTWINEGPIPYTLYPCWKQRWVWNISCPYG